MVTTDDGRGLLAPAAGQGKFHGARRARQQVARIKRSASGLIVVSDKAFSVLIAATANQISDTAKFRHNSRRPSVFARLTCARLFERSAMAGREVSWGAPQTELRDAGLPVA